ncbi:protein kinase family protein [Daejeonella oryzae]|uniref:serine/threonine-protein kinase n=1 Tax=Daejeonella oryzae TaxID=1122943 RepID=UPI000407293D|nr:serine/threonine-protein kinase [Daejeonella oryzae]
MSKQIHSIDSLENSDSYTIDPGGSIFRNKRSVEKETLYRVFPIKLNTASIDDPGYSHYKVESDKFIKLLNDPNPNIETILSVGITEKDSHPFIEIEPLDGLNLQELTTQPYDPVLTIDQVLRIAGQLSSALAHLHDKNIVHGQVILSNIRHHLISKNYILEGLGLSLISAENNSHLSENGISAQKDVFDAGLMIYQLLTGNNILPEDLKLVKSSDALGSLILLSRKEKFPMNWSDDQKKQEMNIPEWLFDFTAACLQITKGSGFKSGTEMLHYLKKYHTIDIPVAASVVAGENSQYSNTAVIPTQIALDEKEKEISKLKAIITQKEGQLNVYKYQSAEFSKKKQVVLSPPVIFSLLLLFLLLASVAVYSLFFTEKENRGSIATYTDEDSLSKSNYRASAATSQLDPDAFADSVNRTLNEGIDSIIKKYEDEKPKETEKPVDEPATKTSQTKKESPVKRQYKSKSAVKPTVKETISEPKKEEIQPSNKYTVVVPKAYFYDEPDVRTRRPLYLSADTGSSNLIASQDTNGFIYVVFFNTEGEVTKGWLRKQDLRVAY